MGWKAPTDKYAYLLMQMLKDKSFHTLMEMTGLLKIVAVSITRIQEKPSIMQKFIGAWYPPFNTFLFEEVELKLQWIATD